MTNIANKQIAEQFNIVSTKELREAGIYYKLLQKMVEDGIIEQVKRGYYQFVSENSISDVPVINRLFPDGVICMESALNYYGYTDRTPDKWHIAISNEASRSRFNISYPSVKAHFINPDRCSIGLCMGIIDNHEVKVYDRERTICDILLHRNKLDAEVFNEAIKRYVSDPNRNSANLIPYAKHLHVEKKVKEVLGIWL